MKQTAVQWFASKVTYLKMNPKEIRDFIDWYEEALEMEKKQIENAFDTGVWEGVYFLKGDAKEYYKETYGEK